MVKYLSIIGLAVLTIGCTAPRQRTLPAQEGLFLNELQEEKDQYELMVFDTQFETWFAQRWNAAEDRSNEYYRSWNTRYVSAWNARATSGRSGSEFFHPINYEPQIDYGLHVNRKLYYYFKYVESELRIPILEVGRVRDAF